MSNLLYMDETNCNGIYASKVNSTASPLTTTTSNNNNITNCNESSNNILHASNIIMSTANNSNSNSNNNSNVNGNRSSNIINNAGTNNINNINIMNIAASTVAMTAAVANANANVNAAGTGTGLTSATLPTSVSNEDLSQSLSEYTDADESISAPTEFLAEFLSAVMLKDYKKALKYCKLILQYEPNNATAKEFYPLIIEKLRDATASDSDENYNKSSSPEPVLELQSSDPSAGESDDAAFEDQAIGIIDDGIDEFGLAEDNCHSLDGSNSHELNVSSRSGNSDSAGGSISDSMDEEVEGEEDDDEDIDGIDDDVEDEDEDDDDDEVEDVNSSSGDDLPIDDPNSIEAAAGTGNNSLSSRNSSSGGGGSGRSRSDNTTHSYSSLLLEEEDDIAPVNLKFTKELSSPDLDVSNGNKLPSTSCSDSESPTEPLTQRLAAILRSKCGVSSAGDNY
ncbi:PREDICTED: probable WRKY transcription factor protein 1 [Bactrocera latifrons]|nr:PREDICTED: probable WRKY transcription factor protein 1 [Bactrocera latifrons]XP_018797225.1 PREDICTED: probable WRKY transcription factor protein 1 [Bactrocera latifrons]